MPCSSACSATPASNLSGGQACYRAAEDTGQSSVRGVLRIEDFAEHAGEATDVRECWTEIQSLTLHDITRITYNIALRALLRPVVLSKLDDGSPTPARWASGWKSIACGGPLHITIILFTDSARLDALLSSHCPVSCTQALKTCVHTTHCRFTLPTSPKFLQRIEKKYISQLSTLSTPHT